MDAEEATLRHEIEWQSEVIDVMFPVVVSADTLMEERAHDHTHNDAVCPICLGKLSEALSRWNAWLHVADGEHKGEEGNDGH